MEEGNGSWVRRAKFSQTVCHRLDSSILKSIQYSPQDEIFHRLKPTASNDARLAAGPTTGITIGIPDRQARHRSKSPIPDTVLSQAFKEARSETKRFSTPCQRRKEPDRPSLNRYFSVDASNHRSTDPISSAGMSLQRQKFVSSRAIEDLKTRKESSWTKYFELGGGKVSAVETMEEWTADLSKLFLGLRFASGAHSKLYHGIYKDQPVAVKVITIPDDDENGGMAARLEKQFNREFTILSHLYHKNVIKLVAACRKPPVFFIITEYLSGGSLRAFLRKLERKTLPIEKLISISLEIARGMEYVHSQGVIHRDLKPENILFDEEFHLKIADFGIACEAACCDSPGEDPGTYRWMAPEMIKHKAYGRKVDVYSFGLVLWELVTGTIPYEEMTPIQAAFAVVNKNLRPAIPVCCPAPLRDLIEQCWSLNPEKRPEFWQIVKVFEQFESSLARDGKINLVQNSNCQDHKKGLVRWIQKLSIGGANSSRKRL